MAASELRAELRYRDGETKKFTIKTENSLKSVISSVKKLSAEVSEVLTDLVEQEKSLTGRDNADSRVDGERERV
uniref:Si:dkeyp-55f12.3 n=1 Tax=Astyanax mexicanus TaxID=7994 RepID=A0A8B9J9K4_ASTMX